MHNAMLWVENHPLMFSLIVWSVFTFLVTAAFRGAERWSQTHPRLAKVLAFLEAMGISAPGLLKVARNAATQKGIAVPATEFPATEPPTNPQTPLSKPPGPNGYVSLEGLMVLTCVFVLGYLVIGCPHLPPPDGCAPETTRCGAKGPQVCSGSQRWTDINPDPCPSGSECCATKSVYDANKVLHACVPHAKCIGGQ